ncbi:hypothetical protein [Dyadobacter frigoris]|uniref:Uncharacterized protein n=1 Tax=Dyadobacter frigoris TaxID=2576211 RepID=A0A4U6D763_9BACT|nr:hypothetical protein [Dyadobacter frigoris]TKT93249.1 hypothetical protein FDK13_05175 [Dyadobacter frigoris]GLU54880.1 hypothetical protein Dfri01_43410 [Dyadobacter frigoris]
MNRIFFSLAIICSAFQAGAQTVISPEDIQIKTAILAAPSDKQAAAKVYGYASDGAFKVLRNGTNDFVCIADDPTKDGINVSCYHADLEPFMERGRVLTKEGKNQKEIFDIREKEVKSKKLLMPKQPATLYSFSGSAENYDSKTGELKDGYMRYVVYIPFATSESTGLPLKPDMPGMPWIMDPGTHRAHIMINPAKK